VHARGRYVKAAYWSSRRAGSRTGMRSAFRSCFAPALEQSDFLQLTAKRLGPCKRDRLPAGLARAFDISRAVVDEERRGGVQPEIAGMKVVDGPVRLNEPHFA